MTLSDARRIEARKELYLMQQKYHLNIEDSYPEIFNTR